MRRLFPFVLLGVAAFAAACSGGGGGASAVPHAPTGPDRTASAPVRVVIPNAAPSTSARKPNFISPATASISIQLYTVNGATPNPQPTPLVVTIATSSDCSPSSNGTSCLIQVTVPVANQVVLQLSSYDASNDLLGQALLGPLNTTQAISTVGVSIGGVPASLVFAPGAFAAGDDGQAHTVPIGVVAKDASNNTIVAPGAYPNPIQVTIANDAQGSLTLASATIASPGPTDGIGSVNVTYNSAKALTQATITATSGSITAQTTFTPIVFTPLSLPSLYTGGSAQTITVSEYGYAGAFTATGTSSVATVQCSSCTPSSPGGSVTVSVSPGSAGTETISIADANGGFANVPITVTSTTGGGGTVGPNYTTYKYATASGGTNFGITVGPDGQTLWYVDQANGVLGAVSSPAGCTTSCSTITEMSPLPSAPPYQATALTSAPDGNIYVANQGTAVQYPYGAVYQFAGCSATTSAHCSSVNTINSYSWSTPAPADVMVAPDGNLYATSAQMGNTTNTAILDIPIAGCCGSGFSDFGAANAPSSPNMMTYDGANNIWFTDLLSGDVGYFPYPCNYCTVTEVPTYSAYENDARRRTSRAPHRSAIPPRKRNCSCAPPFTEPINGIVYASDGYIYVANAGGNDIVRFNAATWVTLGNEDDSTVGDYPYTTIVPTVNGTANAANAVQNLTIGPDGNVWFTDSSGYVGFVSLGTCAQASGCKAYEYAVGGSPWGITAAPDGDVWFTDRSTNAIGKVVLQ